MSGKRECTIYKTNLDDAKDKDGQPAIIDMNRPFILRKGRSILSFITKEKAVSELMDESLTDFKAIQTEQNKSRLSLLGFLPRVSSLGGGSDHCVHPCSV